MPKSNLDVPRYLRRTGEVVLFAAASLAPWLFACADAGYELLLALSLLILLSLWAISGALSSRIRLRIDIVTIALAGLVAFTAVQLIPVPETVASVLLPTRLAQHREFIPAVAESWENAAAVARATTLTWTVDPAATRKFLAQSLGVLLLYVVVRNWLARRENLPYFAGFMALNGSLLAFMSLAHFFSGSRDTILWIVPANEGSAFGPFVCRNHYPDYLNFCLGLGVGWLVSYGKSDVKSHTSETATAQSARWLLIGFGLVLMMVSIPFSLSRAGLASTLLACGLALLLSRFRHADDKQEQTQSWVKYAAVLAVVAGGALMLWFGTDVLVSRLQTVNSGEVLASRLPLWQDAAKLLAWTWPLGAGAGSFYTIEPMVREHNPSPTLFYFDSVHNEFLEALIDGGIIRFGLTLLLVFSLVGTVGRGYIIRGHRSIGPIMLGLWFGLIALVCHSISDFGVRMPAVAFLATTAAAYAMALAKDSSFVPARVKMRRSQGERAAEATTFAPSSPSVVEDADSHIIRGFWAMVLPLLLLAASLFVLLEVASRARASALRARAEAVYYQPDEDVMEQRAKLYAEIAALRPFDAEALHEAGQAYIDVATYQTWKTSAAVGGAGLAFVAAAEPIPQSLQQAYLRTGLMYLQQARAVNPLLFRAHTRLALFANYFDSGEPATVHFARAKKLLPTDPHLWYVSGREELVRGNTAAAKADWKQSLKLSTIYLVPILERYRGVLSPSELKAELVPNDPRSLWAAMNFLYPSRTEQADARKPYLADILKLTENQPTATPLEQTYLASVYEELNKTTEAEALWATLLQKEPDNPLVLERYIETLEAAENYDDATVYLEKLLQFRRGRVDVQDRLDAARRGAALQAEIRKP